jgi:oxygen-dependent protoporphyrinogen oxidase
MAASLGDSLFLGTEVESIEKSEEEYLITTRSETRGREVCSAKEIVLSTDLPAARKLLRPGASAIADLLDPIQSVSLAVVNAGFGPEAFHPPPQGFGFLVPKTERDINILGVLFASSVFPHQAPPGCHSVRIFVGGTRSPNWPLLPEGELVEKALAEMGRFIEVREAPRVVSVSRWAEAVPQMVPGHAVRVAQVEENLKAFPGLSLVGNYLRGVSVNDCVVNARETAARILAS